MNTATAWWLGTAPPQIARQPTSSMHAAAIFRDDRIPLK